MWRLASLPQSCRTLPVKMPVWIPISTLPSHHLWWHSSLQTIPSRWGHCRHSPLICSIGSQRLYWWLCDSHWESAHCLEIPHVFASETWSTSRSLLSWISSFCPAGCSSLRELASRCASAFWGTVWWHMEPGSHTHRFCRCWRSCASACCYAYVSWLTYSWRAKLLQRLQNDVAGKCNLRAYPQHGLKSSFYSCRSLSLWRLSRIYRSSLLDVLMKPCLYSISALQNPGSSATIWLLWWYVSVHLCCQESVHLLWYYSQSLLSFAAISDSLSDHQGTSSWHQGCIHSD